MTLIVDIVTPGPLKSATARGVENEVIDSLVIWLS